jgi:hypothetical protein
MQSASLCSLFLIDLLLLANTPICTTKPDLDSDWLFCALAVLFCEMISLPHANMGVCDDGPTS